MDIDNLKAFVAVARESSFSLAANTLYLTQPAVSKRISALEKELSTPLFDRVGRRVQVTQAGSALLARAESILQQVAEAKRAIADLAGEVRGELRVATSHHLGLHKLPPVLRRFVSLYPEVNLKFEFLDSEVAHERVSQGTCELAVVTLAPEALENLISVPVWDDPLIFVSHRRDAPHRPATLAELSQQPAILPDLNTYTGRLVKACFDQHQLPLTLNMTTNYLETVKTMVSVGLGWSVLPASMLDMQLQRLSIEGIDLTRTLGVVRHQKRHLSNAAEAFQQVLIACRNAT